MRKHQIAERRLPVGKVAPTERDVITPRQLRAARALVGWSREKLAEKSGVPAITCKTFELGQTDPRLTTAGKWRSALEKAGVAFIDPDDAGGAGVRLKRPHAKQ
jgi:DNA-binding XRE family transcriptional regulator